MSRYPGLVLALAWSVALAATVVLLPARPLLGIAAAAVAVPIAVLALFVRPALLALAIAVSLFGAARAELPAADPMLPMRASAVAGATVAMAGQVVDDSRTVGGGHEVLVQPERIVLGANALGDLGDLVVRWRGPEQPAFHDRVRAVGKLVLPRDLPDFDRRAYFAQRHVYLELDATSFDVTSHGDDLTALPAWIRRHFVSAVQAAVPAPHASVLLGIVLGVRPGIPPALEKALIATGLIHLLVLSGLKVAVFGRIVQGALTPLLGRLATWPALLLIGLYALAGGATPAAIRASAMGGLALAAANLGRPSHVWTSLAATAAAMLGWRPELAWDVGFQLSFAGTAAIVLLTPGIARRAKFLPHVVREPFAVTCAAQVGTLPMMATDFHVLSPVAPIANALTLPILGLLVTAGLFIGAASLMPDVARTAAFPVVGLLAYIEQVGYVLARLPAASVTVPAFPAWIGVAYYSALGPAVAGFGATGAHRKKAFAAAAAGPLAISAIALAAWANSPPQAVVLDVGDGQAVLLRSPNGALLIDGGPSPARLADGLGAQLPPWQRGVDALVITAAGLGHVGGLAGFDRAAARVLVPGVAMKGSAWRTAALEQATRGAPIQPVTAGQVVDVSGFDLQVLAPERGAPGDETGAADVAIRVVAPSGASFCDFSDLDVDAQTVAAARLPGTCTYVLLPNGGRSTLSPDLERRAISPTTRLIASRGAGRLAAGYPVDVLRTDQEGTITLPL